MDRFSSSADPDGSTGKRPMILKASIVLPLNGPPIQDGAVVIDDNLVVATGPAADFTSPSVEVVNLGDVVLMPGLINTHCHLDYSTLRYAISPQRSFADWVRRINAIKRTLSIEDFERAIFRGFDELRTWGTTSVCNIESMPELMMTMK